MVAQIDRRHLISGQSGKGLRLRAKIAKVGVGHAPIVAARDIRGSHDHDAIAVFKAQVPGQRAVDDGVHGSVRADAQRQCGCGDGGESSIFDEHAQGEAKVHQKVFKKWPAPR